MVTIRPFRALRPLPEMAPAVASVPYDVISTQKARSIISENPFSFLRVSVSEAEFSEDENPTEAEVFKKSLENLRDLIEKGVFTQDREPSIYIYRLCRSGKSQTGIVACCSLDEYEERKIKPHEDTRPEKVENRTSQMLALKAHTGLIFLAFRSHSQIKNLIAKASETTPIYDFYCADGVRQIIWKIPQVEEFTEAFLNVPALYIADGHHRIESALRVRKILRKQNPKQISECDFVMAGMFPSDELQILPYNRLIRDLKGLTEERLITQLKKHFSVKETNQKTPSRKGEFCMYLGKGKWYLLTFKGEFKNLDVVERLDVSILQNFVLSPILGISDPRTDKRIDFLGGACGIEELERQVDDFGARLAFSMFPTSIEELFEVADARKLMPPKSTWFEPKLKDGLLIHTFGETYESNTNHRSFQRNR
ncbi:MAG: DUF1015 family protein [Pyrinomonadaceae bacterium]|nr:DUF1015 family protein [Pyrinomonadaceae bacterium]MCX7640223.1 DUF1015 family protein [Pyrinomonadaceae bacterium]MDW8303932.1 DUF1015 family protein [Acidobacteriota bacterium]